MEGIAPPLKCLIEMQAALQNGEPARAGVVKYISFEDPSERFSGQLRAFLFAWDQGHDWRAAIAAITSPHRRALLDLLATAMSGQPILAHLEELKIEIANAVDLEIRGHVELLPIKTLIPLLLLQFPAFLVLLFGPLLRQLIQELNK